MLRRSFKDENTKVSVSLLVFDSRERKEAFPLAVDDLDTPAPDLHLRLGGWRTTPSLRNRSVDDTGPTITLPVTGCSPSAQVGQNGLVH